MRARAVKSDAVYASTIGIGLLLAVSGCHRPPPHAGEVSAAVVGDKGPPGWQDQLHDGSDGRDWPAYGRTYGEQHFSPLAQINSGNIGRLKLASYFDLPPGNPATGPIAVGGIVYTATGYSVIRAIDAPSGRLLWTYDPKAPEASGIKLRQGWGSRGLAYWNGKVYTATQDGRLIAIDAKTGHPVWTVATFGKDEPRFISGAPRIFDGMIVIGNAGADESAIRGYVTAYDAETGTQKWRFYTVPGDPSKGFENKAMAMAAKTWSGRWWQYGGGGTVWNAITYDRDGGTILIGTGNGAPWNYKIRSRGKGDNLFLCSIVALDAKTGAYKWHYQTNPGESWDYNAAMDMELADLVIDGKPRKVVMTAPKNGFLYVIDRTNGKLISAKPFVPTSWAKSIDLSTGRPVEAPGLRYPTGTASMRPSPVGAHSWIPMAFSPQSGLVYIPASDTVATFDDRGIVPDKWTFAGGMALSFGVKVGMAKAPGTKTSGYLIAWDPIKQALAWKIAMPDHFNGGVLATGGGLVLQGRVDSSFNAYDAKSGKIVWRFDAKVPIIGSPISYLAGGRQYITVVAGMGTSAGLFSADLVRYGIGYREQQRRVLTFALDGKAVLPPKVPYKAVAIDDPDYRADTAKETAGEAVFNMRCAVCHGGGAISAGVAPDLRTSGVILSADTFASVVHDGMLVSNGMPRFEDIGSGDREAIRQFLRSRAKALATTSRK